MNQSETKYLSSWIQFFDAVKAQLPVPEDVGRLNAVSAIIGQALINWANKIELIIHTDSNTTILPDDDVLERFSGIAAIFFTKPGVADSLSSSLVEAIATTRTDLLAQTTSPSGVVLRNKMARVFCGMSDEIRRAKNSRLSVRSKNKIENQPAAVYA